MVRCTVYDRGDCMADNPSTVIEINNVSYKYPVGEHEVLKNISLHVKRGTWCSLIGSNGSGKTTLCNVIRGFIPHFYKGELEGKVMINGQDTSNMTVGELALEIGFVFQNPFTQMSGVTETVYDELAFGLQNLGVDPAEIRKRVEAVLELTKTVELKDRNPYELSGGQQQRVALASIIVMDPDILVIDEPTSQLDPQSTQDIFKILAMLKERGKTIFLVEHKMDLVAQYADYVFLIDDGEIKMEGSPREVLTNAKLLDYQTAMPQYALLGNMIQEKGLAKVDQIPLREEEAFELVKKVME